MIMVIGGRCQESLPLQKNILKIGYRKRKNSGRSSERSKGRSLGRWGNIHLGRISYFHLVPEFSPAGTPDFKKDETLGLPDEQETALFETTSAGLHNWKNLAETIYNANPDRILVTDEIGYGIVPIDPFEREYREETGRICCLLAEKSEEVWRVCCGIGTRLK